ncbi:proteasome assembly chaperone 2 [Linepithema humile]|uniref:proteasome assembly chaperone 2 n=1 Tax=Linepithema humile TaxID=83485 RepID=UPI0006239239|nr:PREDICTED: proteasome assembly chaperone 2 isoform X1 [Linepithema humile]XP_012229427.1 PREDICTED: proteasome assembly chaperone 2 isoform X2 [Linepithema humile]
MITFLQDMCLEDYTLLLPSVGVGNVSQLCIDLLITNLHLQKIGQICNPAFVPVAGANAYHEQSREISTEIDIYAGIETCIVAIQVRSPYVGVLTEFFEELTHFITNKKIAKVIILSSSNDYEMKDVKPQNLKLRYVASPSIHAESGKLFKKLNWILHEPQVASGSTEEGKLRIPGGGFAMSFFNHLSTANIPSAILFKFCSEGNNITDAIDLLYYLNNWMQFEVLNINSENVFENLKYPSSWILLFGNPPPRNMY